MVKIILNRLHAWGETMEEAFEQCAVAMFGYITELDKVEMTRVHHIEVDEQDLPNMLYHFLDELLYMFSAEPYLIARVNKQPPPSPKDSRSLWRKEN